MYVFNSSEICHFTGICNFPDFPLISLFEKFVYINNPEIHKVMKKKYKGMSRSTIDNDLRQKKGKENENIILNTIDGPLQTQVKKSKEYTKDGKTIKILASIDAIDQHNEHYEVKYRLKSLSKGIRYYEKPQLLMYCDIFDIPYITLLEYKGINQTRKHIQRRENVDHIIDSLFEFVERYESYINNTSEVLQYKKIKSKSDRERLIKSILKGDPSALDDDFLALALG